MTRIAQKYEILKLIGEGATGNVFLVQHVDLGTTYALKVLSRGLSKDDTSVDRFKREASIIARFSHPGTVQLRDFGRTEDGDYYMTMDYCGGALLKDLIHEYGHFQVEETLDIIGQILSVLEPAHSMGIIHRDIKPDNIMIQPDQDGRLVVKVLDFGIAKLKEAVRGEVTSTSEGTAIGTPLYMSPEQAAGEDDLDYRVDLYSTGVVMYELLSGSVPFRGESVIQTLLKHLTQQVPRLPEELNVPLLVEQLVFRALEKGREDRFQTAEEFRQACLSVARQLKEGVSEAAQAYASLPDRDASGGKSGRDLPGKGAKILYLDDDEFTLNILSHVLEREGYKVFTESSFSVIHKYFFSEKVDLFLCDVCMPGMPGPKICKMIKKTMPDLQVVLFSNIAERDLEAVSQSCGADGWISKNKKPAEWLADIKAYMLPSKKS